MQLSGREEFFLNRAWGAFDGYWPASARVRAVATDEELAIINAMDHALGAWEIGAPMPDEWTPAMQRLRLLIETRGVLRGACRRPLNRQRPSPDVRQSGKSSTLLSEAKFTLKAWTYTGGATSRDRRGRR